MLDFDPSDGVGLVECATVVLWAKAILDDMGLATFPVTSGSKGIHVYAPLDGRVTSDDVSAVAHELARALEADHPAEVVSTMPKAHRVGRVFIAWSQQRQEDAPLPRCAAPSARSWPRPEPGTRSQRRADTAQPR